jgi:hypothetical protein
MKTLNKSLVVEAAIAAMFAAAFVVPAAAQDAAAPKTGEKPAPAKKADKKHMKAEKVHCFGINSCKGKSECAVEGKSGCSGKNACKGQGWVTVASAKKCTAKKGTVVEEKKAGAPAAPAAPAAAPATK